MATHNHDGKIWSNATNGAHRRSGPGEDYAVIDTLAADQSLIVLCYTQGEPVEFTNPFQTNVSDAWDFVVISDQDPGGYVADVFIDTHGDIIQQLGEQGRCDILQQRFAPNQPVVG